MSQVAAKKKLSITDERVKVTARFKEQGSVLRGDSEGTCEGFEVELALESDEPQPEIAELIRLAHRMCFTEAALTGNVPVAHRHYLNGQSLTVDVK